MALVIADLVQETTNTTGTGTLTLAGAVSGFQSFAAIGNTNTTYYRIKSGTNSEVGVGTYTALGTTLSRDTVLYSSDGGTTKITVAAGAFVMCVLPAGKAVVLDSVGALANVVIGEGGTTAGTAPLKITPSLNLLTTPEAGVFEVSSANSVAYFTGNTTNGRGLIPTYHYFRLVADLAVTATTISPFFGTNSSIPLVSGGVYEIEMECYFLKTTGGSLTWTITNSAVVTNMQVNIQHTPVGGYTAVPTASALTIGALVGQTAAAVAFTATATIAAATNHFVSFKIQLENASSTSLRLNVTNSAGTITPRRGSYWKATRVVNTGIYAA